MNDLEWLSRHVHEWPTLNNGMECEMIYRHDAISTGWGRHWPTDTEDGSEVTRDQWLAERERLQNKPSWHDAPEWALWLAQSGTGNWFWFEAMPEPVNGYDWDFKNKKYSLCSVGESLGDWRDTLEKKPEQMQRVVTDRRVTNRGGVITVSQTVDYDPVDQASPPTEEEMCSFSGPTEPKHINCRFVMTEVKQEWKQGELPPVGSMAIFHADDYDQCDFRPKLKNGMEVEIIAHYKTSAPADVAVFKFNVHDGFDLVEQATAHCFRSLETEEEKAVEDMLSIVNAHYHETASSIPDENMNDVNWESYLIELYRQGYRKP